ncbi:MarR family winged helix-turn-helix transcriptional regulator [Saccharomonospora iraqiensis]|uniref:MarR family winged helix-turn-helix transcriptional regulator n=1 Tax=Saccharomonospora iraqiensis TaxID=52698 RepID=UPI0004098779|nr:MarR family transcriptional regulator [Saccharomonospora iraqiensis]
MAEDVDSDDEALIRQVRRLTVEADRFTEMFGEVHGLHRTDLNAVVAIMDADRAGAPLSPGELAGTLHLSPSATTSVLDRLSAAGHVRRESDPADRRRVVLRVCDSALRLGSELFTPLGEEYARVWEGFDDAERRTIARFLTGTTEATVRIRARLVRPDQG